MVVQRARGNTAQMITPVVAPWYRPTMEKDNVGVLQARGIIFFLSTYGPEVPDAVTRAGRSTCSCAERETLSAFLKRRESQVW